MKRFVKTSLQLLIGTGLAVGCSLPGQAAQQIRLVYGPWVRSVQVSNLARLAATGEAQGFLATLLALGGQNPKDLQPLLNEQVSLPLVATSDLLNSSFGVAVLTKVGSVLYPTSAQSAAVPAMRSAIVLSLVDDGRLSPLEVVERYPTDIDLNINELLKLKQQFAKVAELVQFFQGLVKQQ
jgi:hypothetical protein